MLAQDCVKNFSQQIIELSKDLKHLGELFLTPSTE